MKYGLVVAVVACSGCRDTTSDHRAPPRPPPAPPASADPPTPSAVLRQARCGPAVPAAACALRAGLRACEPGALDRVGEWRYAVIAPMYAAGEDLTSSALRSAWQRGALAATDETAAAITAVLGPGAPIRIEPGARPAFEPAPRVPHAAPRPDALIQLAIVPADELVPAWKVVTIDGRHPLDAEPGALALPLCSDTRPDGRAAVRNIDPARLTTVALTGVTAMTRLTAELMDRKGVTYPIKDVAPWLAAADLVHISNEVSFVGKECKPYTLPYRSNTTAFCSRDSYIALLEAAHAKIIELTGSHLPDYGRAWIDHSLELYRQRGWVWFGGGHDQRDATAPRIVEHHGNRLAFLGCNMPWTTSHVITEGPGVAACDLERMKWQIGELVRAGAVPIVSIQHEEVYHHDPPDEIVRDFRGLGAAGAAVVNGSQAHCAHPWEVHRGAYLHYGGGNFVFDQQATNTRDGTADRLYIYANRLLTVGHLYTRLEEFGRPRPMTARERTGYLAVMADVLAKLPRADPWTAPDLVPASRSRPDSFLIGTRLEHITVTVPAKLERGKRYPLVIELGASHAPAPAVGFQVIARHAGDTSASVTAAITRFMIASYPVDRRRVAIRRTAPPAIARARKPLTATSR